MIEFLKNYQKIIEFILLFVPLIILFSFLTETLTLNSTSTSRLVFTFNQNNIALYVSDIRLNPDIFTKSYYSCYEV